MKRGTANLRHNDAFTAPERLFLALAEYLRQPLFNIARGTELNDLNATIDLAAAMTKIGVTANNALYLLDSYVLAEQARTGQLQLALEPVALPAVLYDTAHELQPFAKMHRCELQVSYPHRQPPVMAYRPALKTALLSLGQVFIEAAPPAAKKNYLNLSAYRGQNGAAAGVFGRQSGLSRQMFAQARGLSGRARLPLGAFTANSGAGVFVADALLSAMSARLKVAKHNNLTGLAASFVPSRQLSLV